MSARAAADSTEVSFGQNRQLIRRERLGAVMRWVFLAATSLGIVALVALLWTVVQRGGSWLSWHLITDMPSRKPALSGMNNAIYGSLWIISLTVLFAFPVGLGAAIYLEEYAAKNRWTRLLQLNIANLAGVPSIVYGLLGLGVFVEFMQIGRVVLAGALTMALLSLPVIIIASQEALRAVPLSLRQAAYGVGATRWQVVWHHVLPAALPGILTGTILAVSRAIGETAPLLVVGAAGFITTKPNGLFDGYTAIPIQVYKWTSQPQADFRSLAAAGIVVLMIILLSLNSVAIVLRQRFTSKARY